MQQKILHILFRFLKRLESLDRIRIVFFAFLFFACLIIWSTFKYSVLEYTYYKTLADKQQMTMVKNPVSRGTVYSNNDPKGVFATSTDLSDLAIDPKEVGSKEKLETFLTDLVFEEICTKKADDVCVDNMFNYLRQTPEDSFSANESDIKVRLKEDINRRISKEFIDSVIVKEDLSDKEISDIHYLIDGSGSTFSLIMKSLYVDPTKLQNKDPLVTSLMSQLSLSKEELDFKLSKRTVRYVKILRKMNLSTKDLIDARVKAEKENIAQ